MVTLNQFADAYVTLWNERDEQERRAQIERLWAPGGTYVNEPNECTGYDEIAVQITFAHDYYHDKGFEFRSQHNAVGHHDTVKFTWAMVSGETGELESIGFDFVVLDGEGRITADYQYIEKPPSF
jgi:hypothetical protein